MTVTAAVTAGKPSYCYLALAPELGATHAVDARVTDLTGGRVVRGIVEGDSVPDVFLPRLFRLWEQGRFPVDRLMTSHDFAQMERAVHDVETGKTIKAVLRIA